MFFNSEREQSIFPLYPSSIITKVWYAILLSAFSNLILIVIHPYDSIVLKPSFSSIDLKTFEIAINGSSSLGKDIEAIRHYPNQSKIEIVLKNDGSRRCKTPVFRGRLSGQSLSIIDWEKLHDNPDIFIGNYSDILYGTYFIEIIVLQCNEINYLSDFKDLCVENPTRHRITADKAKINVIQYPKHQSSSKSILGVWMGQKNESVPLYTRYQDADCRLPPTCNEFRQSEYIPYFCEERCMMAFNVSRFRPYHYVWNNKSHASLDEKFLEGTGKEYSMCFLGASHSRLLTSQCKQLISTTNINSFHCIHIDIKYPTDINATIIKQHVLNQKCTHLIIGLGQWSAGWPENKPTLFPDYHHEMLEALNLIQNMTQNTTIEIFLRSTHYNAMNYAINSCPPSDWRSIPVLDWYNKILQNITQNNGLTYLDTNSIIGPLWDSAPDLFHFNNDAGEAESLYLLREVTGMNR